MAAKKSEGPFDWSAASSLGAVRLVLEHYGGRKIAAGPWARFKKAVVAAKGPLIKALGGWPGRKVIPVAPDDPTEDQAASAFHAAARGFAVGQILGWVTGREVLDDAVAGPRAGGVTTRGNAMLSPAGTKLGRAIRALMEKEWADTDMSRITVDAWVKLRTKFFDNLRRKGLPERKPTNAELIEAFVTRLYDAVRPAGGGTLVLSANPLDILLISESASFKSCHCLAEDASCRSGALQYLLDGFTAVAYFYKEERKYKATGARLPHKLWRRLVFFGSGGAVLSRQYPTSGAAPDGAKSALDEAVAATLDGGDNPPEKWGTVKAIHLQGQPNSSPVSSPAGGPKLAYVDCIYSHGGHLVFLGDDPKWPSLSLAKTVPCPNCVSGELTLCNRLRCLDCSAEACSHCGEKFQADALVRHCGEKFCNLCYGELFYSCGLCGTSTRRSESPSQAVIRPNPGWGGERNVSACPCCVKTRCRGCHSCKAPTYASDLVLVGTVELCRVCLKKETRTCNMCDGRFAKDSGRFVEVQWHHDCRVEMCGSCVEALCKECPRCHERLGPSLFKSRGGRGRKTCRNCRSKSKAAAPAAGPVRAAPAECGCDSPTTVKWAFVKITDGS